MQRPQQNSQNIRCLRWIETMHESVLMSRKGTDASLLIKQLMHCDKDINIALNITQHSKQNNSSLIN